MEFMSDTTQKINGSTCPLFEHGLYIEKLNNSEADISMCCYQKTSQRPYHQINFRQNDYLNYLRNQTGEVLECEKCSWYESRSIPSYRQAMIQNLHQFDITPTKEKLTILTYNCENICNLTCLTCGPKFSSKWRSVYSKLNWPIRSVKKSSVKNELYKNLDFSSLRLVHFQGGEPLLTNDHEEILTKIDKEGDIDQVIVSYNTNGTQFPNENVINLWSKTKLTKLYFSIDAVGSQFELIRNPAKWQEVESNLIKIKNLNLPNVWIEMGVTVSIANIFYLQEIINWRDNFFSNMVTGDPINIYVTAAIEIDVGGKVLSFAKTIPSQLKEPALEYINSITDDSIKNSLVSVIKNSKPSDRTDFIEYMDSIDTAFGLNWRSTLSKLNNFL